VVGLVVWALIVAARLERGAQAAPFGARRTVSLIVLRPLSAVSGALGFDRLTGALERALGIDESGQVTTTALPPPTGPGVAAPPESPLETETPGDASTPDERPRIGGNPGAGGGPEEPDETVEPLRTPTPSDKLRFAVIGDSFAVGMGQALGAGLDPELVHLTGRAELATGLARPDFFNWPAEVSRIANDYRPDVLVVMLGSNDAQPISYPDGRVVPAFSHEWGEAYRAEVDKVISAATSEGTRVVWVGLPPMRETFRQQWARNLNERFAQEAQEFPAAEYVDTMRRFGGTYSAYLRQDGQAELIRASDGVHFTTAGYAILADIVIERMMTAWSLDRAALA
jgi:hypothetical protein